MYPHQLNQCHLRDGCRTSNAWAELFLTRASHRELHDHDGQAENDEKHQVKGERRPRRRIRR